MCAAVTSPVPDRQLLVIVIVQHGGPAHRTGANGSLTGARRGRAGHRLLHGQPTAARHLIIILTTITAGTGGVSETTIQFQFQFPPPQSQEE